MPILQNILTKKLTGTFFLIAGPCVVEKDLDDTFLIAEKVKKICDSYSVPYIFKASYRKANRTSIQSFQGIGDEKALSVIAQIGKTLSIPTITDIHASHEAAMAAEYADILQIPAFLCRQTDLLQAAAQTGKVVNVKKGQFLNGASMSFAIEKIKQSGNQQIMLTDRGNMFGYQDLVVDYRNLVEMSALGVPVVMDCTHSLQKPNSADGVTGGDPKMIATIAKAAIAVGADGLFIETHPKPQEAKSDGKNMLALDLLEPLVEKLTCLAKAR